MNVMAERGVMLVSMIWLALQHQFNFLSCLAFEYFVKAFLVMWDRNRKALHRPAYRHCYCLSMVVFPSYRTYEVSEGMRMRCTARRNNSTLLSHRLKVVGSRLPAKLATLELTAFQYYLTDST